MEIIGILAYPAVLLAIGILGLLLFRKPISRKIEAGGLRYKDLQIGAKQQAAGDASADAGVVDRVRAVHELATVGDNPALIEGQKIIEEELQKRNITDSADATRILTRYLAAAVLATRVERIYGLIFGAQISVLRHLNGLRGVGEESSLLRKQLYEPLSDELKRISPFDRFIGWMEEVRLITLTNQRILITDFGVYFLTYMTAQGLYERS